MRWLYQFFLKFAADQLFRAARVEAVIDQAESKARLLRQATVYEAEGLKDLAEALRHEAATIEIGLEPDALTAAAVYLPSKVAEPEPETGITTPAAIEPTPTPTRSRKSGRST